jgi:hypothetical protein
MTYKKIMIVIAVLFLIRVMNAGAEEKFEVEVYSEAKYDVATSKNVSESFSVNASCYRTNDSVAKVVEFYKKQSGLEFMGGGEESAMFKKGDVDITIQNPWMDMESGEMMKDTLISIVKH